MVISRQSVNLVYIVPAVWFTPYQAAPFIIETFYTTYGIAFSLTSHLRNWAGIVGESDDVLFHAVPLLSNGILPAAVVVVPPLCNDVDIADGTYAVAAEWTLNEVAPDAFPVAVLRWFWIWVLFSDVDIRFDAKLLADAVVAVMEPLDAAVVGNTCKLGDFGEFEADSDIWLLSA